MICSLRPASKNVAVFLLSLGFLTSTSLSDEKTACFNSIVQPTGWAIPPHSAVIGRGAFTQEGVPPGTRFTKYRVRGAFFLPHYSVENGKLVLTSLRFRVDELTRLEIAGVPFAFVASVRGADVGIAGRVGWLDRDGDGRFEEFQWWPKLSDIPQWVAERASHLRGPSK